MAAIPMTAAGMAKLFLKMEAEMNKPVADPHGVFGQAMERACRIVEKEAKDSLGTYHRAVGPFPAWAKLADSTVQQRTQQGWEPDEPLLRLGTMRDSIHHVVKGDVGHVGSDDPIAEYQELGTSAAGHPIPPRSFLGRAAFVKEFAIHRVFLDATMGMLGGWSVSGAEEALGLPLGRFTTTTGPRGGVE